MSNTDTATKPAEVLHDLQLTELLRTEGKLAFKVSSRLQTLKYITRPANVRYERDDLRTQAEIVAAVEALIKAGDEPLRNGYFGNPSKFAAEYNEDLEALRAHQALITSFERQYTGWQRFYLVTSSAGLVHASTSCSTCHKGKSATQFALVADFSGRPVKHLVEAVGPLLCSVCFPEAPTEWQEQERLTPAVAEVLFELGYDAFQVALAKLREKRAANALKPKVQRRRRY